MLDQKSTILIVLLLIFSFKELNAAEKKHNNYSISDKVGQVLHPFVGEFYINKIFVNMLQSPLLDSVTLQTLSCSDKVKVYQHELTTDNQWVYGEFNKIKGFFSKKDLEAELPLCFKKNYPKFYNTFPLSVSEQYYWGRISNRVIEGKTNISL